MPWLTIIMFVLSFILSKKSGSSTAAALGVAALAGGATYAVTHYTDWGQTNLGQFDGVAPVTTDGAANPTVPPISTSVPNNGSGGSGLNLSGLNGMLPIAAGAVGGAALASSIPPWLLWGGIGLLAYSMLK